MDICRFIKSKDIRKYLRSIDYRFNTLEAAYLIYFCDKLTLRQKHSAWKRVIETMPDMSPARELPHCRWKRFENSIHSCLKNHIEHENKLIKEYESVKEGAFLCRFYDTTDKEIKPCYWSPHIASDSEKLNRMIEKEMADDGEIKTYMIICRTEEDIKYEVTKKRNGEIIEIFKHNDSESLGWQLEDMWFDIPTPFKRGDIVIDSSRPESSRLWSGPFVLDETAPEFYKRESRRGGWDYTDMTANGYFQDEDGSLYGECMHDYLALEYFPVEKLKGVNRVLIALSGYLKGEYDAALFANAYHYILMQGQAEKVRPYGYIPEVLKELKL